ncbi:MAG: ABC transporter permease [Clostridia bacterium]
MNKEKTLLQRFVAAPYLLWSALFILAPLVFVAVYAFTDASGSFSLSNFTKLFNDGTLKVFVLSLAFAFIATIICLLIAYPLAYFISRSKLKNQNTLIMLFILPMWMNFLLRTYALSFLLEDNGLINKFLSSIGLGHLTLIYTSGAVIFGMVYNFLPYMILPIYSAMSKIDKSLLEAADDLGCNKMNVLKKIILPLSLPGIASGITMVFVPSVSTFYISQQLGPTDFVLIGDIIETQFKASVSATYNYGSAISLVLMMLILICMAIMNRFTDENSEGGIIV